MWGRDPGAWGSDYYQRIGVSFELPNLYHKLAALENLRFFASLYAGPTQDPMALLESVDLAGGLLYNGALAVLLVRVVTRRLR